MDLDEVLWENETRREWWRIWLGDLESHIHATDNYRSHFTGLDDFEPDAEPEMLRMLAYLKDLLQR